MKFQIDHDLHIHTCLSSCSKDPYQNKDFILEYAKENKLTTVAITDHYWDALAGEPSAFYAPQNFEHIREVLPLPESREVKMLFGCESELRSDLVLGVPEVRYPEFDFIIIPTTHLHMKGFTVSEEDFTVPERLAKLWVSRLDAVLDMALPFEKLGIAHLTCTLVNKASTDSFYQTMALISHSDIHRLYEKAAKVGAGIELNAGDIRFVEKNPDLLLPFYKIAKEEGCKFYLGSDAHHPSEFKNTIRRFGELTETLGLTEDDKIPLLLK